MTDHAELIERLRDVGEIKDDDAYEGVDPRVVRALRGVSEVMKEGANAIAALVSERDRYKAELVVIEDRLGDYIERKGAVDVMIALAYETARAALAQGGEK